MLSLQSPRWSELRHAYGPATDIPELLDLLSDVRVPDKEPWFSLWSALAHQGDVYSATFAAVPHVIAALASAPDRADAVYLQFPAWVEICRARGAIEVPEDLRVAYFDSLGRLPALVAQAANRPWDGDFLAGSLAAIAAAKGHHEVAEAALELSSAEVAQDFLAWRTDR